MNLFGKSKPIIIPKRSPAGYSPAPPIEDGWHPYTLPECPPVGIMVHEGVWDCAKSCWKCIHTNTWNSKEEWDSVRQRMNNMDIATRYWRLTGIGKIQLEDKS